MGLLDQNYWIENDTENTSGKLSIGMIIFTVIDLFLHHFEKFVFFVMMVFSFYSFYYAIDLGMQATTDATFVAELNKSHEEIKNAFFELNKASGNKKLQDTIGANIRSLRDGWLMKICQTQVYFEKGTIVPNSSASICKDLAMAAPVGAETAWHDEDRIISLTLRIAKSNNFLLPVIYGYLGAITFSLYNLLQEKSLAITARFVANMLIRAVLGGLCGFLIGFINIPSELNRVTSSSLFFSFVAGYSIDIILMMIKRVVAVFDVRVARGEEAPKP